MAETARPKVFVTRIIPAIGLDILERSCDVEVWPDSLPPPFDALVEKTKDCDGLLCLLTDRIDAALLDACPKLRVVSTMAVGFNNIDVPACTARGIPVGNTPGVLTEATADVAMALLTAAARRVVEGQHFAMSGAWQTWDPCGLLGQDLPGRTLGIVGLGRIGAAFARRCRGAWGMKILYHNRKPQPEYEAELDAKYVDFETLLAESDIVSVHTDLNPSTKGMFHRGVFQQMKPSAIFLNTARGGLVVQADLVEAMKAGEIFAAGLDVTEPEPPSPDDPILHLPNVVVTPHVGSATFATRNAMAELAANNLLAGLAGQPLPHPVNPDVQPKRA